MFKLDKNNDLIFNTKDLKEVYEPIITQFGFEYEPYLDKDKKGLVWTKLYEGHDHNMKLWPTMVIREGYWDTCPAPEEATYFSTSLWWEISSSEGLMIGVNSEEFDDGSGDEVEDLIIYTQRAQKEVNDILEKCRQQLVTKLTEIKVKLIAKAEEN